MASKLRKNISYFAGWFSLMLCSFIVKITPQRFLYSIAQRMGLVGYHLAKKQRNIALESLRIAFGEKKSQEEIEQIAKDCFCGMTKSAFEIISLVDRPDMIRTKVTFEGKENLDKAFAAGKGVILVSAHFGNFPLMLGRLSLEGYPTAGIMRPMRDARTEKLFAKKRSRYNVKTIYSQPRKVCVDESIRFLRAHGLLFLPLDQNFGTAGVFVDFFGRKAATATGPVVLAQRTGAAVVPVFIVRQPDNTNRIIFEHPLEIQEAGTERETILKNIQSITSIIETYIRRYPAEWGWIHRRWKSKEKS